MTFQRELELSETETVLSRIWTQVTDSISYYNNCFAKYAYLIYANLIYCIS